jgi:hypothetical protein
MPVVNGCAGNARPQSGAAVHAPVITPQHLLTGKRMVTRHRYHDRIFPDFHRLDVAEFERNGCVKGFDADDVLSQ